eukprot:6210127-Pleurochrysis_carterae.AAC.1
MFLHTARGTLMARATQLQKARMIPMNMTSTTTSRCAVVVFTALPTTRAQAVHVMKRRSVRVLQQLAQSALRTQSTPIAC